MVELVIIIVVLCLLIATGSALIALRLQHRSLDNTRQEREAWQQAQEGRQRTWEVRQGKHILNAEKKLADQLKDARREWRDWSVQVQQEHQEWRDGVDLTKELARLPHIEHLELTHQTPSGRLQPKDWQPPMLYKADLQGRDLSYRYMERADLREAQLMEANLYMADLTGASLAGANLQQANLIGANLSGADLRGANLADVNLLVTDLHNAVLHGTNLRGARGLTPEQLQTAIYDSTTLIDSAIDITLPRIPGVLITPQKLLAANPPTDETASAPDAHAIASPDKLVENDTPAPTAEIAASTTVEAEAAVLLTAAASSDATALADINPLAESADAAAPSTETSEPMAAASAEGTAPVLPAQESADAPVQSIESTESISEDTVHVSAANKKSDTARKRSSKAKPGAAASATPLPAFTGKQEEANVEKRAEERLSAAIEEDEEPDAEELLSRKIIQWPARAPKTGPLAGSGDQNKGDQMQKQRGNSRTANLKNVSGDAESPHAQAN